MNKPNILIEDQMPILRPLPMPDGAPHREWRVMEDWYLDCKPLEIKFFVPKGFIFNGASVPRVFSNIFPATGYLFIAALIHDYLYSHAYYIKMILDDSNKLIKQEVKIDKCCSDQIFKDISNWLYKGHWFKTGIATAALKVGGQGAWDTCRKADGTYIEPKQYKYEEDDWN